MQKLGGGGRPACMLWVALAFSAVIQGQQMSCGVSMAVPKVAMMFLIQGGMPLSSVWEAWFKPLAGYAPFSNVQRALCTPEQEVEPCSIETGGDSILASQFLYTVYIHSSLTDFTDFAPGDLFYGTLIKDLTKPVWGDSSLATRSLMRAALEDPFNQRFVLLSDFDAPMYSAKLVYAQLMSEQLSRLATCQPFDQANINRYTCAMAADGIQVHHWRKNSPWFMLIRPHVELLVNEEDIRRVFAEKCSGILFDKDAGRYRGCLVDEHYYSTVFAKLERTEETDCKGVLSATDITRSGQPKMYLPSEIDAELVNRLREPISWLGEAHCANTTTYGEARENFVFLPDVLSQQGPQQCASLAEKKQYVPIESWCPVYARKFRQDSSGALLRVFETEDPMFSFA